MLARQRLDGVEALFDGVAVPRIHINRFGIALQRVCGLINMNGGGRQHLAHLGQRPIDMRQGVDIARRFGQAVTGARRFIAGQRAQRSSDTVGKLAGMLKFPALVLQRFDLAGLQRQRLELLQLEAEEIDTRALVGICCTECLEVVRNALHGQERRFDLCSQLGRGTEMVE